LGCETGQAIHLIENQGLTLISPLPRYSGGEGPGVRGPTIITVQQCGGIAKTVEAGVRAIAELLPRVNDVRRVKLPASKLMLGTNCGGSDGNSGVTANPAVGDASDLRVAQGCTIIIAETPVIYGSVHLLTRRADRRAVGGR